jgi:hypothetical protein
MKTQILAGLIFTGVLATSVAQAAIFSPVDETYSGLSTAEIQMDQRANPAASRHAVKKETCAWLEPEGKVVDQLHAAYPGSEKNFGEKDYLATSNQDFVC